MIENPLFYSRKEIFFKKKVEIIREQKGEESPHFDLPEKNPGQPALRQEQAGENDPVHQPWRQLARVVAAQGLVGGEDGEEESRHRPAEAQIKLKEMSFFFPFF
jgi:hypothetical protein